jgi:uncharacterized membrane protein YfcA
MSLVVIIIVSLLASALTLISGFGLGTLLLPVFAIFFPIEVAVAMTAIVHVLNNIFKFGLLWRSVNRDVLFRFGLPGIVGAFLGAQVLLLLGDVAPWHVGSFQLEPIKTIIGLLMVFFALTELFPKILAFSFSGKHLVFGGAISGFFGGLSGHQGALRSMFLIKVGMAKEVYIATGVAIALLVDFTRIPVYFSKMGSGNVAEQWLPITAATLAAFAGALVGKRLIPKITLRTVHILVGVLMIAMGIALIFNWL